MADNFFSDLKPTEARDTVIHWPQQIQNLVDKYKPYCKLFHAVQKDGIQNP